MTTLNPNPINPNSGLPGSHGDRDTRKRTGLCSGVESRAADGHTSVSARSREVVSYMGSVMLEPYKP